MAIRDDFLPGEVLASADLNDTFAAKSALASPTFTGTPAAPTAAAGTNTTQLATTEFVQGAGGLVLVASESFSAVSSVSVNGCFTSAHQNYRVVYEGSGSGTNLIQMRLRVGGVDTTTSYLNVNVGILHNGTATNRANIVNQWETVFTSANNGITFDITRPNEALMKSTLGVMFGIDSGGTLGYGSTFVGQNSLTTAHDGLSVFVSSGNITGTLRIYGYKNS